MKVGAKRVLDLAITASIAGAIALTVLGPTGPAPAAAPTDTYTRVAVTVDDHGVRVSPSRVPAGQVEFALTDRRSDRTQPVAVVGEQAPGLVLHAGTRLWTQRALQRIDLHAIAGGDALGAAVLSIVVPELAAPAAPDGPRRVTVDVADNALATPWREARYEQPLLPNHSAGAPSANVPWTTADAGRVALVLRNRSNGTQTCTIDGAPSVTVARGRVHSIGVTFRAHGRGGANFSSLRCRGSAGETRFDFWIV